MEEKKERKAVAKKIIEPMMKEWEPISPKMPVPEPEEVVEEVVEPEEVAVEPVEEPVDNEPRSRVALSDNKSGLGMGWYVVHTYSGYENKVKANIEKAIENRHLENEILEVRVPLQDVVEVKDGVEKSSQKKLFPGYVLLHMDADNNDAWYVVRNTRGVTGFVGPGSKPVPLTEAEMKNMGLIKEAELTVDFNVGDAVTIISDPFENAKGIISAINLHKQTVTVNIDLLGRETPVEVSFTDVRVENY